MAGQEDMDSEGCVHVESGCTERDNKNMAGSLAARRRQPPHGGHRDGHNKEAVADNCLDSEKSNDWGYGILVAALVVEVHSLLRSPCDEMEDNEDIALGNAPLKGEGIVYLFHRNLALLRHAGAAFPYSVALASTTQSSVEGLSRNIRDSMH